MDLLLTCTIIGITLAPIVIHAILEEVARARHRRPPSLAMLLGFYAGAIVGHLVIGLVA